MKIVGRAGLRVVVRRQAADVPAVAHRQQRQHRDLRVLGGVQRAEQDLEREVLGQQVVVQLEPQRLGLEGRLGQIERSAGR